MKKSKISLLAVLMLVVVMTTNTVFAAATSLIDTTAKGSITIKTLEQNNGSTATDKPIKGVTYTLYKVDDVAGDKVTTVAAAETAIEKLTAVSTATTGTDGVATFSNLAVGRYYADVTAYPTGTSQVPESFLVDVPTTDANGTGWNYNITVQPKVQTITKTVTITKLDAQNNPMDGINFTVQISTDAGKTWTDYVKDGETEVVKLTTNTEGKITLENLPTTYKEKDAIYRVIETSTDKGYIIDNAQASTIEVTKDGKVKIDGVEDADAAYSITNEIPTIEKKVKTDTGTWSDVASISKTEKASYKVTASVPTVIADLTTYTLTDTLPAGLTGREKIVVKGLKGTNNDSETIETTAYTQTDEDGVLTLTFTPDNIAAYHTIVVTYDAKLDMDKATIGKNGNINTAVLKYTNNVDAEGKEVSTTTIDDTAKVVTGAIKVHKVGEDKTTPLAGAKFKVATDANATTFVKDTDGNDLVVTSGDNGYVTIAGLAYNDDETSKDYWLVETETPTYTDDNGETKHYQLLTSPVKFAIGGTSESSEILVVNKKQVVLPLTGGIGTVLFAVAGVTLIVVAKSIKKDKVSE